MSMLPTGHTFLWHDYETFGANSRRDRPAQFAAIRTDHELKPIGDPVMLYCQPAVDVLPDPEACLITGITPQLCQEKGLPEHAFAARIETLLSEPGTIGVGYNTIRFDDEMTRFMFWRNLIDPYAREWQNGCGRWDLLDVVRLTHALRPDGIVWPTHADGRTSFKLEDLSRANGLLHEAAHDALSDVRATIALAQLIREKQPRLFDFCLGLHKKDRVAHELSLPCSPSTARPFLHVSGMFGVERGCLAVMWPLASHPHNRNELLAWDLSVHPGVLADMDAQTIRRRLFTRQADLGEGESRLPIKSVHLNKSPMVVSNLRTLTPTMAERWGLNMELALSHAAVARDLPDMSAIWDEVFARSKSEMEPDVDEDLYGGFLSNDDRRRLQQLRRKSPSELASARVGFDDARLEELFFRYRARNFPQSLSEQEAQRWLAHRAARLIDGEGGWLTIEQLFNRIDELSETLETLEPEQASKAEEVLGALYDYASEIAPA